MSTPLIVLLLLICSLLHPALGADERICSFIHHGESPRTRNQCDSRTFQNATAVQGAASRTLEAQGLMYALRKSTQTISRLTASGSNISFVPIDGMFNLDRTWEWVHALGDITLRVRPADRWLAELPFPAGLEQYPSYVKYTTAAAGPHTPATPLPRHEGRVGAVNITGCLSGDPRFPLQILRWYEEPKDTLGGLRIVVDITNRDPYVALDIGALSASMVFQGRFDGIKLINLPATTVLVDAYQGLHHGYVTVTAASGRGPVLVVLGENGTSLEAWGTNFEDPDSTILGTPEWIIHSAAYQEEEWKANDGPWNVPSRKILQPKESMRLVLRLAVAPSLRHVDDILTTAGKVVAKGVPGYVCSTSFQTAKLFLKLPEGLKVLNWSAEPAGGLALKGPVRQGQWTAYPLTCEGRGRVRLTLQYSDGSTQAIHYFVVGDVKQHVDTYGQFQASTAWLPRETRDPFGRSASVMPWDSQAGKHVLHDSRAFVVGLSDEAGAGANVGLAIKAQHSPSVAEAQRVDEYINSTLWGIKSPPEVPFPISLQVHDSHGIRASLFYVPNPTEGTPGMPGYSYLPGDTSGWIWGRNYVNAVGRAYNYPHQVVSYWSMYRIARNHDLLSFSEPASWYLEQAGKTVLGMWKVAPWYTQMGLMAGTVFELLLADLRRENMLDMAGQVEEIMYNRTAVGITYWSGQTCDSRPADPFTCVCSNITDPALAPVWWAKAAIKCPPWRGHPFPFGSEFAWDTTGQEEVYVWSSYFNFTKEAQIAIDAILAFMPGMPHWAYNGAALGMGDFSNNAKWTFDGGWERVLCHYRTGLNNIPVMREWLRNPTDTHLLGVGMGALAAHITNINEQGAARMGFHADPSILQHDPYSGDFGVGFFGHSILIGSYLTYGHLNSSWLCYFCDVLLLQPGPNQRSISPKTLQAMIMKSVKKSEKRDPKKSDPHSASTPSFWGRMFAPQLEPLNTWIHSSDDQTDAGELGSASSVNRPLSHWTFADFIRGLQLEVGGDAWTSTGHVPVQIVPRDSYHRRVYVQTLGLQVELLNGAISNADVFFLPAGEASTLLQLNITTSTFPYTTRLRLLLEAVGPTPGAMPSSHKPAGAAVHKTAQAGHSAGKGRVEQVQRAAALGDDTHRGGEATATTSRSKTLVDEKLMDSGMDGMSEEHLGVGVHDGGGPGFALCGSVDGAVSVQFNSGVWEVEMVQPVPRYIQLLVCSSDVERLLI